MHIKKSGILSLSLLLILIVFTGQLLGNDTQTFLIWWAAVTLLGIGVFPMVGKLFSPFEDKGWLFSKGLGVACSGFVLWFLCSLKLVRFTAATSLAAAVLTAVACFGVFFLMKVKQHHTGTFVESGIPDINLVFKEELLFYILFLLWAYLSGFRPEAHGTEKFMDYGFMAAMMRSDTLPAPDIWHAPDVINYYYGGQYFAVFLTKLTRTRVEDTYNLMRALVAAMLGGMSFSVVYQSLRSVIKKNGRNIGSFLSTLGGLFGTASVVGAGNFHYVIYGLIGKRLGLSFASDYWFPNSTRYIGHNPETADKCIHEFPCYSFVLGDLHAHVVNTMFVIIVIGLMLAFFLKLKSHKTQAAEKERLTRENLYRFQTDERIEREIRGENSVDKATVAEAAAKTDKAAIAEAAMEKTASSIKKKGRYRFWLETLLKPQLIVCGLLIGIFHFTNYWDFIIYYTFILIVLFAAALYKNKENKRRAISVFLVWAVEVLLIGSLAALPFTLSFQTMVSGVALAKNHTAFYQLLVLWGLPVTICLMFAVVMFIKYKKKVDGPQLIDGFVLIMALSAIGLILIPELVYVRDIYENGYARSNTMFKLTYQAFILFGLAISYILIRVLASIRMIAAKIIAGVLMLAQIATCGYFVNSVTSWYGKVWDRSEYRGLDATRYIINVFPEDYQAIKYLNEKVDGNAIILEANGDSYSDYARVSAMTGLSAPLGWYVHEWLWRGDVGELNQRSEDIKTIYTSDDASTVKELLSKYQIEYIYIGKLEYEKYEEEGVNTSLLTSLGKVVFNETKDSKDGTVHTYIVSLKAE